MPMRLNPPPGWPPVPRGWVPPPGWQPDPSWPEPPPGWPLWVEDTANRNWHIKAAIWAIAGGAVTLLGALLPFLSVAEPGYYVTSAPKDVAITFGIIIAGLGLGMLANSRPAKLTSGILTLIMAAIAVLILSVFILAGSVGGNEPDGFGSTVQIHYSPGVGIIVSILGCVGAGVGAIMSFMRH